LYQKSLEEWRFSMRPLGEGLSCSLKRNWELKRFADVDDVVRDRRCRLPGLLQFVLLVKDLGLDNGCCAVEKPSEERNATRTREVIQAWIRNMVLWYYSLILLCLFDALILWNRIQNSPVWWLFFSSCSPGICSRFYVDSVSTIDSLLQFAWLVSEFKKRSWMINSLLFKLSRRQWHSFFIIISRENMAWYESATRICQINRPFHRFAKLWYCI